jgi:hypothetical protein
MGSDKFGFVWFIDNNDFLRDSDFANWQANARQ